MRLMPSSCERTAASRTLEGWFARMAVVMTVGFTGGFSPFIFFCYTDTPLFFEDHVFLKVL